MDTNATGSIGNAPLGGSLYELTQITQGTTEVQRVGLDVNSVGMKMDLNFTYADAYNKIRVVVFRWDDDTAPVPATFFAGGYPTYVQTPWAWPFHPKMKILYDTKNYTNSTNRTNFFLRKYLSLKHKIRFTGSASTSGIKGRVYIFVCSDSSVAPHPTCTGYIRYLFKD